MSHKASTIWRAPAPVPEIALHAYAAYDIQPLPAALLFNRGIRPEEAVDFLLPHRAPDADPASLPHIAAAVARIVRAKVANEAVCIYGDYDVDGLTGQAVLALALRAWGIDVVLYTPHRVAEGYGVHAHVAPLLAAAGVTLVITVDCGTTSVDGIVALKNAGIDAIVIDHHPVHGEAAVADAILVNPAGTDSPYAPCAGVGVAFGVILALAEALGPLDLALMTTLRTFVALGTVADVVPLIGENRRLVAVGLLTADDCEHSGLMALARLSRVTLDGLTTQQIGFALAPRINAASRIAMPEDARELLLPADPIAASCAALRLEHLNRRRKAVTAAATNAALLQIAKVGGNPPILITGNADWSPGIVGLIASALVNRYHRPAIIFSVQGSDVVGSARSIPGVDIAAILARHADRHLTRFGGHAMAAGCALPAAGIPDFARAVIADARQSIPGTAFIPQMHYDAVLDHTEVTIDYYWQVQSLAPYGNGNAEPVFLIRGVRPTGARGMGAEKVHLSFAVMLDTGERIPCIAFNQGDRLRDVMRAERIDLYCQPVPETYYGDGTTLQLDVRDWRIVDR